MNEPNVYDLVVAKICGISLPRDVYEGGFTEGGGAVEGGVGVAESVLLCWGLNTGRICGVCEIVTELGQKPAISIEQICTVLHSL